jgi:apolipoprotein N-acyltransferase
MDPDHWMPLDPAMRDPADPQKPYFSPGAQERIADFQRYLRAMDGLLSALKCPLLAGGSMPARGADVRERLYENAAVLFTQDGGFGSPGGATTAACRLNLAAWYGKMHLVPFSEYVPCRRSWPWMFNVLRQFVPAAMAQLEPGHRPVVFHLHHADKSWTFAAPICYEGVFARVCRELSYAEGAKVNLLINLSNDGWFVYQGQQGTWASAELEQHLAQYKFRAIENRVGVVRAVNCGVSGSIDSNGRLVDVVQRDGQRQMVCGTMVAQVLVDSRVSPYSWTGDLFAQADSLAAMVVIGVLWRKRKR